MNLWRCLGISLFLVGAVCLVGTLKHSAYAQKSTTTTTTTTKPIATTTPAPKPSTTTTTTTAKVEPPKEVKAPTGDTVQFKAFDSPFFQVQETNTTQKMTVMSQPVEQKQIQTFVIQWTPEKKKGDDYMVKQKIVGVKMEIDIGGNKIAYDSNSKTANPKNPMTDFFEQLTKPELTFQISPKLKVENVDGREAFIKNLSDINPQMQGLLKAILSKDALVKMAEPAWWAFPEDGKLVKDQTWQKKTDLDLGPIGTYKTTFDFKYAGQKDNLDIIEIKTKLEYSAPKDDKGSLPFIIKSANLSSESGTGEAKFDRVKGRFVYSEIKMKLKGTLVIEVGNMQTKVDLEQDQTAISKTYDTNPWAEKK